MNNKPLTFFHNSTYNWLEKPEHFNPRLREGNKAQDSRPAFYWFNDIWHSNFPNTRENYFYLFVKNPRLDKIEFRSRHGDGGFNDLFTYYSSYLQQRIERNLSNLYGSKDWVGDYCEPAILMSFSTIEPDLVLHFDNPEDKSGTVIKPEGHLGKKVALFDEKFWPIKFTDNPEIVEIVPQITNSLPFVYPEKINGNYDYEDWVPMLTVKSGTWL